jgi:hypothetical protein
VSSRIIWISSDLVFKIFFVVVVICLTWKPVTAAPSSIPYGYSSEIINVKFREGTVVNPHIGTLPSSLLSSAARVTRSFSLSKENLDEIRAIGEASSGKTLPDLNMWFQIALQPGTDAATFLEALRLQSNVEIAEPAPLPAPPPAVTPNFTEHQGYLGPAPDGIEATFSSAIQGGNGSGVTIYDIEFNWNYTHEDISRLRTMPLIVDPPDTMPAHPPENNHHGTAVAGILIADNDTKGITGISWGANIGLVPATTTILGYSPANAIIRAVAAGRVGDVVLIELHTIVCEDGSGNGHFGPLEWDYMVFEAIQFAVSSGFVVVEAAGNGGVNLDDPKCLGRFDPTVRDSGAIIVGAGGPPSYNNLQRLDFSSYGGRVGLQGWGKYVTTAGYGPEPDHLGYVNPDDPINRDYWYTHNFDGTSSAAAMVAGAVANLQGVALNRYNVALETIQIFSLLAVTGSKQLGNWKEHIGPRPHLSRAIDLLTDPRRPEVCDGRDNDGDGVADEEFTNTDGDRMADCVDSDDDNDGIQDVADNCPLIANTYQFDRDFDGFGDACDIDDDNDGVEDTTDNCPFRANSNQLDTDNDRRGNVCDTDDDNDGILDTTDNCPLVANPTQIDTNRNGIGDTCDVSDIDGDKIPDAEDECPRLATPNVITGTAAHDRLTGTPGNDLIRGLGGNDKIYGKGGDDCLVGGDGNDQLWGHAGNDISYGGAGNDKLVDALGDDVLDGGDGKDVLDGGPGNDRLNGGSGDSDRLDGGEGNDAVDGGDGVKDRCAGGAGIDTAKACELTSGVP